MTLKFVIWLIILLWKFYLFFWSINHQNFNNLKNYDKIFNPPWKFFSNFPNSKLRVSQMKTPWNLPLTTKSSHQQSQNSCWKTFYWTFSLSIQFSDSKWFSILMEMDDKMSGEKIPFFGFFVFIFAIIFINRESFFSFCSFWFDYEIKMNLSWHLAMTSLIKFSYFWFHFAVGCLRVGL